MLFLLTFKNEMLLILQQSVLISSGLLNANTLSPEMGEAVYYFT